MKDFEVDYSSSVPSSDQLYKFLSECWMSLFELGIWYEIEGGPGIPNYRLLLIIALEKLCDELKEHDPTWAKLDKDNWLTNKLEECLNHRGE